MLLNLEISRNQHFSSFFLFETFTFNSKNFLLFLFRFMWSPSA